MQDCMFLWWQAKTVTVGLQSSDSSTTSRHSIYRFPFILEQPHIQEAVAVRAQEGREELLLVQGQEGQRWGDTPRPRLGAVAALCWSSPEEIPHAQGKRNPVCLTCEASEGRHTNHNHRKLANLITQTTALSNSMKLSHAVWGHPRQAGRGGEVWQNVVHWGRESQTTSVFLPWEPHE